MRKKISFDEQLYKRAPINSLIIFGIHLIIGSGQKCTFEKLVKRCFTLFPKSFSFSQYSKWPDARKLDRPLRTLRNRKLIIGNPKTFFTLTKKGKKLALEITQSFTQRKLL